MILLPSILLGLFLAVLVLSWMNLTKAEHVGRIFAWWASGLVAIYGAGVSALFLLYAIFPE